MGIKNLHPFLRKLCPQIYHEVPLHQFRFQKMAVDVSIYLCKLKTTYGKQWLDGFIQFVCTLRNHDIHPIFIFDTEFPIEKQAEKQQRAFQRNKLKEKVQHLTQLWEQLKKDFHEQQQFFSHFIYDELRDVYLKIEEDWKEEHPISIQKMDMEIEKLNNSLLSIRLEDYELIKELCTLMKIPFYQALGEAEATCSLLNKLGYVDAVMSEDTDVLAYSAPVFVHRISTINQTCVVIYFTELLCALRMHASQFLDFCIMCGTDYNKNMSKIGPDKSYRLLQKYDNLENIEQCCQHMDLSILSYPRVRQLFSPTFPHDQSFWKEIPFCGFPDMIQLSQFFFHHNLRSELSLVQRAFFDNHYLQYPSSWNSIQPPTTSLLSISTTIT